LGSQKEGEIKMKIADETLKKMPDKNKNKTLIRRSPVWTVGFGGNYCHVVTSLFF
jgi:hypothetical protein